MSWSRNTHGVLLWKLEQHVAQFFIVQNSEVMTGLLEVKNTMSSLQIAELTGKAHSNVMRDIRNILEQLEDRGAFNFELTSYIDKSNRESPCYQLTKKDCLLLASGYDANLRAKIINRWEELETAKRNGAFQAPQNYLEALEALVISEKEKQCLRADNKKKEIQISNLTPKAEFADCFLSCKGDITIGELANILNQSSLFSKGRNKLREWLRKNGYLIKRGTRKNKPTQKSMSLHLMRIASTLCNTGEKNVFREEVMVTARGQKHFITQFRALLSSKESYEIEW